MGKGEIISHIGDGQYSVKLLYDHRRSDTMIEAIDEQVIDLDARIAALPDGSEKSLLQLQRASLLKRKQYLLDHVVKERTTTAWCADLTEDLTGQVGTIEINSERGAGVQIQPGHDGNAAYDADRDGQLQSTAAGHSSAVYYNMAMLPGWQKWMPLYRYGTITAIDTGSDTCSVTLDPVQSSAQSLNINLETALTNVPVEYMSCNAGAFDVGDEVVVQFTPVKGRTDANWGTAKVIGFREEPQSCYWEPWGHALCENNTWFVDANHTGPPNFIECPSLPGYGFSVASGSFQYTNFPYGSRTLARWWGSPAITEVKTELRYRMSISVGAGCTMRIGVADEDWNWAYDEFASDDGTAERVVDLSALVNPPDYLEIRAMNAPGSLMTFESFYFDFR